MNSINPKNKPINVVIKIPIIIAPGIFLTDKIEIARNPIAANKVSIFEKLPSDKSVAWLLTIIPPFLSPISPINNPTPAPIAILKLKGILEIIQLLNLVMLIIKKRIPAIKTAPSATSHE